MQDERIVRCLKGKRPGGTAAASADAVRILAGAVAARRLEELADLQLYHCRDLGEPFDFLTWFEYAPADADRFEELVRFLRASEEWKYVIREVDLRLTLG